MIFIFVASVYVLIGILCTLANAMSDQPSDNQKGWSVILTWPLSIFRRSK